MLRTLLLILPLLLLAVPAGAQTAETQGRLEQALARGRLIYRIDRAAWVATDYLLEHEPAARTWPASGWIVEPDGDGADAWIVTFYGPGEGGPVALYVARTRNGAAVSGAATDASARPRLTASQVRLAEARATAVKLDKYRPCTPAPFNAAIVPPVAGEETVDVYLLSPGTNATPHPFGGHFLVRVGMDGRIVSDRKFTNSCINMAIPAARPGRKVAAAVISHLLDPQPTEIHVFLALSTRRPIFVGIGNAVWSVTGEAITLAQSR